MNEILNVNERWLVVGGQHGMTRAPMIAVLVAGTVGDYAVYSGLGDKEHAEDVARFGDKLSFKEATCHFPNLEKARYRE